MNRSRLTYWFGFLWLVLFLTGLSKQINLANSDLPRHLANGRWVWTYPELLHRNFWSSASPDFPFVNHHWAFGAVMNPIYQLFGWVGLSAAQILLLVGCAWVSFQLSLRADEGSEPAERLVRARWISVGYALLFLPLLVARVEVRPETVSYLFLLLTWSWAEKCDRNWIWIFPLLTLAWVNLHSVFFLGLVVQGIFLVLESDVELRKKRGLAFGLSLIASLFNPNGLSGALVPFTMLRHWTYDLVELQPIWNLLPLPVFASLLWPLAAILGISVCAMAWAAMHRPRPKGLRVEGGLFLLALALGAAQARNLSMASFILWPLLARWTTRFLVQDPKRRVFQSWLPYLLAMPGLFFTLSPTLAENLGVGLMAGQEKLISFIQDLPEGRVFNTFEVGGLVTWAGFPRLHPWIDNRPEAFSMETFQTYRELQADSDRWKAWQRSSQPFDWVILNWHDPTSWASSFRRSISTDAELAPVYIDSQVVIYARRQERLGAWIQAHEIRER